MRYADCNRIFSITCLENHEKPNGGRSICEEITDATAVSRLFQMRKQMHVCGEFFCKICQNFKQENHLCYIQQDERKRDCTPKFHEPNLCVLKQFCDVCIGQSENQTVCMQCGVRQILIRNNPVVCIAHYGQSFDFQLILSYILEKTDLKPEVIMRGTKIFLLTYQYPKFNDSLNYFPMALAKFPKSFGLAEGLKKGMFPHLFNTQENQFYVGPIPDQKYYDPDSMKPDVDILAQACIKFRKLIMKECNVCPSTEACTIACVQ
ncbi:hypothetical protein JTB14_021191 [Gonioctena quinquepunctata]|nr:hypothetical protein JTB14_021191 [Gonioctena quinquepunctata]